MKHITRVRFTLVFAMVLSAPFLGAQSLGSGISVFFPESMLAGEGSIAVETGLSTSVGIGSFFSIPVGAAYIKIDGLVPNETGEHAPWLYSDSLIAFTGLRGKIDLGPVALAAGAGGALHWSPRYRVLEHNIAAYFAENDNETVAIEHGSLESTLDIGVGWYAETGIEYRINPQIGLSLSGRVYHITADYSAEGRAYRISDDDQLNTTAFKLETDSDFQLRLRGLSIGIGGSFSF